MTKKKKKDHFLQVLQASNFPKNKIEIPQMYFPCDKFQCIFSASVLKIIIWDSSFSDVKIFGRHRIKQEEKLDGIEETLWEKTWAGPGINITWEKRDWNIEKGNSLAVDPFSCIGVHFYLLFSSLHYD